MRPAAQIAAATQTPPSQIFQAVIDSVQEDGSVNLNYQGAILDGIPCSPDADVAEGDVVIVATITGGVQCVVARFAGPRPPSFPDLSGLAQAADIPPQVTVTISKSLPTGSGWTKGEVPYVRYGSGGARDIWFQTPVADPDPPPPTAPPAKAPASINNMTPTDTGAWRSVGGMRREDDQPPRQSNYASSYGPYTGAWFFSGLGSACSGKTVSKITVSLARSSASNGIGQGATVRLYLTTSSKPGGSPPSKYSAWSPGKLGRGSRSTWTVPSDWRADLASGKAKGIVCYSSASSESIIFSKTAYIDVTFS